MKQHVHLELDYRAEINLHDECQKNKGEGKRVA